MNFDRSIARLIDHTILKPEATRAEVKSVCAEALRFDAIGVTLAEELGTLAPFGHGNPRPTLLVPAAQVSDVRAMGEEGQHSRFTLCGGGGRARVVAFRTFVRTLLHELMHHVDLEGLRLPTSFHTEGFFKRESSVFHQLVPGARRERARTPDRHRPA